MTIQEVVQGLGSWDISLSAETPKEVLDRLLYFGHVAVVTGRVQPAQYGDNLLTMARYVGVLTSRDSDETTKISGQSMLVWLGDGDGKGEVLETAVSIAGQSFANSIRALLGSGTAVVEGTLNSVAGTYTGTHQWESRRSAIEYVCSMFNAEYRVNGNATLDAGTQAQLYRATPTCVIVRKGAEGRDLSLTGMPGDMELTQDVEDWTSRVVLLAEGEGATTATGSADIGSNPYLDIRGNAVKRTRLISESTTSSGNATARAQLQLNRFVGTRNALRLSTDQFEVDGSFRPGDMVWVYDPDAGLFDTNNEVTFRGQRINPIALRTVEASWPVTEGMTVAYRHQDGTWYDLTDYVQFESGSTTIGVGELGRSLTSAGTEPVGGRPIPDSTIPGVVTWDLPFTTGVYLDALGNTWARILVNWLLPLNSDGSTVLDGSHYEIQYGVSPATDWQTTFAPWGDLQAQVLDLAPGTTYDFRIRAVDLAGNQGAWSDVESATASPDTIPPSTPATPTVAASRIALQVTHTLGKASGGTYNLELDLHHLEIHVGGASTFTPDATTLKGTAPAHSGMIQAHIPAIMTVQVEETTARWVRVIACDEAGNRSSPSAAVSSTALLIDDAHITNLTVDKIDAGTISSNWLIGASIRTASSGQRVELNTSGLQMYNSANTQLVSIAPGSTFFLRSGTTGARIDISTVTGLQIYNASSVRTAWLDVDGSFELRSGTSGARIELDTTGLRTYNSSGQQTISLAAGTGDVSIVGQLSTAFSGARIVVNPTGGSGQSIRFYPQSGTNTAQIYSTGLYSGDPTGTISLESGTWTSAGTTWRGGGLVGGAQVDLWVKNETTGQLAGNFQIFQGTFHMGNPSVGLNISNGNASLYGSWAYNGVDIKSFIIPHPLDAGRYLIHGCTESPHNGVEYWGSAVLDGAGRAEVELPSYFEALTHPDGRAVLTTSVGETAAPTSASYPDDGRFVIYGAPGQRVSWLVKAIRSDVPPVLVEPRRDEVTVRGDGPYRYYSVKEPHHV